MTVKKAIEIIDWWIGHKTQVMEKLKQEWHYDDDKPTEVTKMLIDSDQIAISNLEAIKAQLSPNCRHPKKIRNTLSDGQVYCMNCNLGL
jgi:hypothetical protein